jgi:S-adenosylmethionine synthetase
MRDFVLTSEAVTAGHPDKLSDQISDAVVDSCLASDPATGCVAECALASGVVFLSVRHGAPLAFDPAGLARRILDEEGYGMAEGPVPITVMLDLAEDPVIEGRVPDAEMVATRMTTAFGFACDHTPERMPLSIACAQKICFALEAAALDRTIPWLSPDAQAQVAVRFEDRHPIALTGITLGVFAGEEDRPSDDRIEARLKSEIVDPILKGVALDIDPDARFSVLSAHRDGGPRVHAGLTGRKTASDSYGGYARHSGSALSGKDPSRVDRIAAYAARQAAASVVASGLAGECEVQLSFVPGETNPVSVEIDCFGSADRSEAEISKLLKEKCDLRVGAIVERLGLWDLPGSSADGFYRPLSRFGHFGRTDMKLPWDEPLAL